MELELAFFQGSKELAAGSGHTCARTSKAAGTQSTAGGRMTLASWAGAAQAGHLHHSRLRA